MERDFKFGGGYPYVTRTTYNVKHTVVSENVMLLSLYEMPEFIFLFTKPAIDYCPDSAQSIPRPLSLFS
jgi:hypothetical protein